MRPLRSKPSAGKKPSIRRTVTIPSRLASEIDRIAKEKQLSPAATLVQLAARGLQAETATRQKLAAQYDRFMNEDDKVRKSEAGKDLIRTVFGSDAIAEDSV
jgi:metal-responsive CopG/Arc/MetJ family transcriptional regulator